jgi:Methyltransferase domain
MRFVRGRVLDLGCGAGRVGVHLQSRGHEVVGIDVSPLAVEVAAQRGLADARLGTLDSALRAGERFDTILLLGNNLGLLAGERQGRHLLRKLARAATGRARILAGSFDPYDGASELARGYHARNRARGKMGGVERLRVRYRQYATPWYDVLSASREELVRLVEGTGWVAGRFVDNGPGYVAVLDLDANLPKTNARVNSASSGSLRRALGEGSPRRPPQGLAMAPTSSRRCRCFRTWPGSPAAGPVSEGRRRSSPSGLPPATH